MLSNPATQDADHRPTSVQQGPPCSIVMLHCRPTDDPKEATRDHNVSGLYHLCDPHVCEVAGHDSGILLPRDGTEVRSLDLDMGI